MKALEAVYDADELQKMLSDAGIDVGEISNIAIRTGSTGADHNPDEGSKAQ